MMNDKKNDSERLIKMARPGEAEAVRTTIVGGRPPGSGKGIGNIPRGMEVLIKKAAIDANFRELLLNKRAGAAEEIGLELTDAEKMMLTVTPREQLKLVIAKTDVEKSKVPAFLGKTAAVMLAALSVTSTGCESERERERAAISEGVRPDRPAASKPAKQSIRDEMTEKAREIIKKNKVEPARALSWAMGSMQNDLCEKYPEFDNIISPSKGVRPDYPDKEKEAKVREEMSRLSMAYNYLSTELKEGRLDLVSATTQPTTQPATKPTSQPATQPVAKPPGNRPGISASKGIRPDIPDMPRKKK